MQFLKQMRPWARPEITSIGRRDMRPRMMPFFSAHHALETDPLDREQELARNGGIDLNGLWDFTFFTSPEAALDALETYFSGHGSSVFRDIIPVPSHWTLQGWDHPHYTNVQMPFPDLPPEPPRQNPTGLYRISFSLAADNGKPGGLDSGHPVSGQTDAGVTVTSSPERGEAPGSPMRWILHLGGAESLAMLWVNGSFLGLAKDTRLESEFDISPYLRPDESQELIIAVVRYSDASFIEDQDQWWMAGIHRDVFLYREPEIYIKELRISPRLMEDGQSGSLGVDLVLDGFEALQGSASRGPWEIEVRLLEGPGDLLALTDTEAGSRPAAFSTNVTGHEAYAAWMHGIFSSRMKAGGRELAFMRGSCSGGPASDGIGHESPNRADRLRLESPVFPVLAWSGEQPWLYTLLVTLRPKDGIGAAVTYRRLVGFRRLEIRNRQLLINGCPVLIHGVNRHEHDPAGGKVLPPGSMIRDLVLLKENNFNAVRTAHYPNHPDWYLLCDRFGMYLWDEANIEAHHYYNELCRDRRYASAFLDRVSRMVLRDFDHASVLVWSLGNEAGYGPSHDSAAAWVRRTDPSRPLHYEPAVRREWGQNRYDFRRGRAVTDIIAPMYAPVSEISEWALSSEEERDHDPRPLILCEYSHAMGNSNGGLEDYYQAFRRHGGLQGGFIWDWVDQGLDALSPDGQPYWAYGGDFGDSPNDLDFCINGLVWPDRRVHPAMDEFRKLAQPFSLRLASPADRMPGGSFSIELGSLASFASLSNLKLEARLEINGRPRARAALRIPSLAPGEKKLIDIDFGQMEDSERVSGEQILHIELFTEKGTALSDSGRLAAWEQWRIRGEVHRNTFDSPPTRTLLPAGVSAHAAAAPPTAVPAVTPPTSAPPASSTLDPGRLPLPELCLWRAPTDNDLIRNLVDQPPKPGHIWLEHGLNRLTGEWKTESIGNALKLQGSYRNGARAVANLELEYSRAGAGWIRLAARCSIDPGISDLPRIGLRFTLPEGFEKLMWYGRGPGENYPDRCAGSPVGLWTSTVTNQYVPYIMPQEHGGHSDTRYLRLERVASEVSSTEGALSGAADQPASFELCAESGNLFHFSALHSAPEDLDSLTHSYQVRPRRETILIADFYHRGLGTAACGPDAHPRFIRGGGDYHWEWYLRMG